MDPQDQSSNKSAPYSYEKAFKREREAREQVERLLEDKSRELHLANLELKQQNESILRKSAESELFLSITDFSENDLPLEEVLKKFLESVCKMCGWPLGHALWVQEKNQQKNIVSSRLWYASDREKYLSFMRETEGYEFGIGQGLPGRILETSKSAWIEDIDVDGNFCRGDVAKKIELHGAFAVPIKIANRVTAVAEFFTKEYSKTDTSILGTVSSAAIQLGVVLEKKQSVTELRLNYEALQKTLKELTQTQQKLVQSEKMASVGILAAGVAHEINNPLGFINSNFSTLVQYIEFFKKYIELTKAVESKEAYRQLIQSDQTYLERLQLEEKEDLEYILDDIEELMVDSKEGLVRVIEIVQNLKTFARVDEAEKKDANINDCIEATLKMIPKEIRQRVSIIKNLKSVPSLFCFPGQLNQVFLNLIVNAGQAIADSGTITLETDFDAGQIIVRVSDTGCGIPQESLDKIFDPFYTTKPVGQGTGLGLSISFGIIEKHGGKMKVSSEVGKGTVFTLLLPIENPKGSEIKES